MSWSSRRFSLRYWLRNLSWTTSSDSRRKPRRRRSALAVEFLEDRIVPATLTDPSGTLVITLDIQNEALTISGSGSSNYTISSTQGIFNGAISGATFNAGTGALTLTSDSRISIVDDVPGTSVNFGKSDAGSYDFSNPISVNLSNPLSGNVAFTGTGTLTFEDGLTVETANGDINQSSSSSTITDSSFISGLDLTATEGTIGLAGKINNANAETSLSAAGNISAANSNNVFGGGLSVTTTGVSPAATIESAGALQLNAVNVTGNLIVTAGGALTQTGAIDVGGTASFTTSTGSITLDNSTNVFTGDVSATVNNSGADNVTIADDSITTFNIGTISMGSGNLELDQLDASVIGPDVTEDLGQRGIKTSGNVTIGIYGIVDTQNLNLGAANSIGGTLTINGNDDENGNLTLRNTSALALTINNYQIANLTLEFDDASISVAEFDNLAALPSVNTNSNTSTNAGAFDNLSITAESITEDTVSASDAVIATGTSSFKATNGSITLGNTANDFQQAISADVSLPANNTNSIKIDNNDSITLGTIVLDNGSLTLNDDDDTSSSTISEGVAQADGGGISTGPSAAIYINIVNDTNVSIDLNTQGDDFGVSGNSIPSTVNINVDAEVSGTAGDLDFGNNATGASLNQVMFTNSNYTINNLTVDFSNAAESVDVGALYSPIGDLPLSTATANDFGYDLTVTSGGTITDSAGITVNGTATFTVLDNGTVNNSLINVSNAANDIGDVSLNTPSSALGNVTFLTESSVTLENCTLGTGTLNVTAGGNISEDTDSAITQGPSAHAATFTANGGATEINLAASGDENVFTGSLGSLVFDGSAVTVVEVENFNPAATLGSINVGGLTNLANLDVTFDGLGRFDNPVAPQVLNLPNQIYAYNFSLVTAATIELPSANTLGVSGGGTLSLESLAGDINLFGVISVTGGGFTYLTTDSDFSNANNIIATNASNKFGTLSLESSSFSGGTIDIVSAGTLTLGNSNIASASLTATANTGPIQQEASTSFSDGGPADFITLTGAIVLDQTANNFTGPISAASSTSVANATSAITIEDSGTLVLGTISPQDGNVSLTGSAITENTAVTGGGIQCSANSTATLSFTVGPSGFVDLSEDANNISGPSTVTTGVLMQINGSSTTGDFELRNVSPFATLSQVALNSFSILDLLVEFDNTSIDYNTASAAFVFAATGNLILTAGGNITQTSAIATSGTVELSLTTGDNGDGSIILNNAANDITGPIYFSAPNADNKQQISLVNNAGISLEEADLGLASFTLTANNSGNIHESDGGMVSQGLGGGAITLNAAGTNIVFSGSGNELTGPVTFNGTPATNDVQTVAVNATGGTFTLTFNGKTTAAIPFNASTTTVQTDLAALATIGTGNVQVTGSVGNYTVTFVGALGKNPQNPLIANSAGLTGGTHTAGVTHTHTGGGALDEVTFTNDDPLATLPTITGMAATMNFILYDLPNAPVALGNVNTNFLQVQAGGDVVEQAGASLIVNDAEIITGDYGISLTNAGNNINEISLNNSGANAVAVTTSGALVIDSSQLGDGPLTITAGGAITESGHGGISESPGINGAVGGINTFIAGANPILLDGPDNGFFGPISVTATGAGGHVTIVNNADVTLDVDNVGGGFSVTSNTGEIRQWAGGSFTVGGGAFFSAYAGIVLENPGNSIAGTIAIDSGSDALLDLTGSVALAGSTVNNELAITATGSITQSSGAISAEGASLTSTTGSISLPSPANTFNDGAVSLIAPAGSVTLADSDVSGLSLDDITFGSGGLSLTAAGDIEDEFGAIVGSGSVTINNSTLTPINVDLEGSNNITGAGLAFALSGVGNVTIDNAGNIEFTTGSTLAPSSHLTLDAGGTVSLPNGVSNTLTLGNLNISANTINVDVSLDVTDVGISGNAISLTGTVVFGSVTLNIASDTENSEITINGSVSTSGPVTVDLPAAGELILASGTWAQGAGDNLTINGTDATVDVQSEATLSIAAGDTVTMNGEPLGGGLPSSNNEITVEGTLQIGGAVTLNDGGSGSILTVVMSGTLLDSLGTTVGVLTLNGTNPSDQIDIAPSAVLSGYGGVAPGTPTTILQVLGGGVIQGQGSVAASATGAFLMGTDMVTATQSATSISIQQAAATAGPTTASSKTASVTGNEPDGDKYVVSATDGAAGVSLVVNPVFDNTGSYVGLDIVVRGATAATTLTVTTTANGGDGFTLINGIAIDGSATSAATISASLSNVRNGNIVTAGPLTSLTLRNWTNGSLQSTGLASQSTAITGGIFQNVNMDLGTKLNTLTVAADTTIEGSNTITAASFGTISVTGNAATGGYFDSNLVNTNLSAGTALTSATIAGILYGQWDLAGSVGTVTVGTATNPGITTFWSLGVPDGPGVVNAGKLTNVTSLSLGTASNVSILASGTVSSLTAISLNDSADDSLFDTLQAKSFGAISTTGSSVTHDHGNFVANITATGNVSGTALTSLTVTGNLGVGTPLFNLDFHDGNVGTITVDGAVQGANLNVGGTGFGNITKITAGDWVQSNVSANNITSWAIAGNLTASVLGYFVGSTVTLTGTLGTLSTSGNMESDLFTIAGGSVTSITVGSTLSDTTIDLTSTAGTTTLGTISAEDWQEVNVTAHLIGTAESIGRAATATLSALNGDIEDSTILAFGSVGTTPSIGTLSAKGEMSDSGTEFVWANNGITTFSVARDVQSVQVAADLAGGTGGITTLTAGSWNDSDIAAYFMGTVSITGYTTPEQSGGFVNGDLNGSDFILSGSSSTTHNGINTMTVQDDIGNQEPVFLSVPFGIGTLTVTGAITASFNMSTIDLRNALTPASGALGTLTAGEIDDTQIFADEVTGTTGISVIGRASPNHLNGDFLDSNLAIGSFTGTSSAPVGVTQFKVVGNLGNPNDSIQTYVEIKDTVTTFSVGQSAIYADIGVAFDPVNTNATVTSLSIGAGNHIELTANSIETFKVTGNSAFSLAADLKNSQVTLIGSLAGVGLGTFTAGGHVQNVGIHVTSGNVASFTTGYFIGSGLFVGYTFVDPFALNDTTNNGQSTNWEGTFTLGSFTTTAVLNNASPATIQASAGFQESDVVAGKLGTVTISGLEPTPATGSAVSSFGVGFRTTGGSPATSFKINGVTTSPSTSAVSGAFFFYFGVHG